MKTFVLRSSDNALIWVKDMPKKPDEKDFYFPDGEWRAHNVENVAWQKALSSYQSALKQAIENGIKVADQLAIKVLLEHRNIEYPFIREVIKLDTPYALEVETEVRREMRFTPDDPWKPEAWTQYPNEKRIIAYLVETKVSSPEAESQEENEPNMQVDEWISVDDEPTPDFDGQYLCCIEQLQECGAIHRYQSVVDCVMNIWVVKHGEIITHWRPLPIFPVLSKKFHITRKS